MASGTSSGYTTERPQDKNKPMKRHQIKVNTGQTSLNIPNCYKETVCNSILKLQDIKEIEVDVSQLYCHGSYTLVENSNAFSKMIEDISNQQVVAIDYEFHTEDAYNGFVSAISICTWDEVYVLDPLYELWDQVSTTFKSSVLENADILKVFHNMDNDVLLGQTTFNAYMVGVVDLNHMFQTYKSNNAEECYDLIKTALADAERQKALKKRQAVNLTDFHLREVLTSSKKIAYETLVNAFFGKKSNLQKDLRRSDWRIRPLGPLLDYAAQDSFYLLGLFHLIFKKISFDGLKSAMELSTKELFNEAKIRQYVKIEKLPGYPTLTDHQITTLNRVYTWRINIAKKTDRNPKTIMDDFTLVRLSKSKISSESELSDFIRTIKNPVSELLLQKHVLLAYLNNDENKLQKLKSTVCHNCNTVGHLAFECSEKPSAATRAQFMNRPENKERKEKQRDRRNKNYQANLEKRKLNH